MTIIIPTAASPTTPAIIRVRSNTPAGGGGEGEGEVGLGVRSVVGVVGLVVVRGGV
jgi:hypothetical protein